MTKVSTNINSDPVMKKDAQALLKDLGIDLTTVVTIFCIKSFGNNESLLKSSEKYKIQKLLLRLEKKKNIKYARAIGNLI